MGDMLHFNAGGRSASGYLSLPPSGSGPGLIVIQEYWGLVDHIKDVADRFAAAGFVALAPDLFHGDSTTNPDEAGRKMMALNIRETSVELRAAAEVLRAHRAVSPKKLGVLGFCMGGQLAMVTAIEHGDLVDAAVNFYGVHPNVELDFTRLRVPVLAHFGKHDGFVSEDKAQAMLDTAEAAGAAVEAHFYDAGHAFFNDSRPEAHDKACSDLAWQRTLAFLRTHLGQ